MGIEYYLVDHDKKISFFLGKGNWQDALSTTLYDEYREKLITAFSDKKILNSFLNEPYNRSGNTSQIILDRITDELFLYFSNSKNIDLYSDSYYAPPEDYKEVGEDIYELKGYYKYCGIHLSLESLPPQEYICSLKLGHEGCHKDQNKDNYEWI